LERLGEADLALRGDSDFLSPFVGDGDLFDGEGDLDFFLGDREPLGDFEDFLFGDLDFRGDLDRDRDFLGDFECDLRE